MKLAGHIALITGASGGLGGAIAIGMAREGADLVLNYCRNPKGAEAVADAARRLGRRALCVQADVRVSGQVGAMIDAAVREMGEPLILVNNAGILRDNLAVFMKNEEWKEVLETHLDGAFLCSRHVARLMARRHFGRIINLASVAGLMGDAMRANYAAAKAGLIGLTKTLARELAASGITVNAIAPGWIETPMTEKLPEARRQAAMQRIPLGRLGRPDEVAAAAVFLASPEAAYITGEVLCVDGGMRIGR